MKRFDKFRGKLFSSLRTRILFFFALTASLTILVTSVVIGQQSSRRLIEQSVASSANDLVIISEKMDAFLDGIEAYALTMIYARQWQRSTPYEASTSYENFTHFKMVYAFLLDLVHTNSNFQSVAYYEDEQMYISDPFADLSSVTPEHLAMLEDFRQSHEVLRWYDLHPRPYARTQETGPVPNSYALLRKCYDTSGQFLGIIELSLSEEVLAGVYANHDTENASFFIVNREGVVCSSPRPGQIGQSVAGLPFTEDLTAGSLRAGSADGGEYLYVWRSYPRMGWTVVGQIPQSVVTRSAREMVSLIIVVGVVAMLLSILVFVRVAGHITGPLNAITTGVARIAKGDYGCRIPVEGTDEIGMLAGQINEMTANTQRLMGDIEREHGEKRRYELSYIQSQMNPHFLYNSLETLCGMIEMGEYESTIRFIGTISRFYRGVLSKGDIAITIGQELDIVDSYLAIMQKRYPACFTYEIQCDGAVKAHEIAKLSLQPVVENAVVHGCVPSKKKNHIAVEGTLEDGFIRLRIRDDGAGMPPERLDAVKNEAPGTVGFGFSNTEQRLRLQLGPAARVDTRSKPGEGTEVVLWLPVSAQEPV